MNHNAVEDPTLNQAVLDPPGTLDLTLALVQT